MAIGAIMSNGQRYDGHNGYEHRGYKGPTRTIIVKQTVSAAAPTPAAKAPVAPAVNPRQAEIDLAKSKQIAAKPVPVQTITAKAPRQVTPSKPSTSRPVPKRR